MTTTNERPWIAVADRLLENKVVVETKNRDMRRRLYRIGKFWYSPQSCILRCDPTHWREIER